MDRFGSRWENHAEKIARRWNAVVRPGDTVVMPGDFSWADTLSEAEADFRQALSYDLGDAPEVRTDRAVWLFDAGCAAIMQKHLEDAGIEFMLADTAVSFSKNKATMKSGKTRRSGRNASTPPTWSSSACLTTRPGRRWP